MSEGKIIIFSAPSGAGKTTIVKHLLQKESNFGFSVSATNRAPRGKEVHGRDYYFLSTEEFKQHISNDDFLEWEEVYPGNFYGTLKSEVDRIFSLGKNILFDVDVVGGSNIKKYFGDKALAVFIQPPSLEELEKRLINRCTDDPEVIRRRVAKAAKELQYAPNFDLIIVNNKLDEAFRETEEAVHKFLNG